MESDRMIKSLDGLRGIAVLIVIFSHTGSAGLFFSPYINLAGYGQFGVLLFFFLSAFSLSRPFFMKESTVFSFSKWTFYFLKRLLRILPLYYVVLLSDYLYFHTYIQVNDNATLIDHLSFQSGLGVFWTMPVEMKFYLILPLLVLILVGCSRHRITRLLLIISVLTLLLLNTLNAGTGNLIETFYIHRYLPCFILGTIVSYIYAKTENKDSNIREKWLFEIIALLCILLLIIQIPYVWYSLNNVEYHYSKVDWALYYKYRPMLGELLICIMVLSYLKGVGLVKKSLTFPPLRYIGKVSFSMYLIHMTVIYVVTNQIQTSATFQTALVFLFTFLISCMTYLIIERPFILLPKYISTRRSSNTRLALNEEA